MHYLETNKRVRISITFKERKQAAPIVANKEPRNLLKSTL